MTDLDDLIAFNDEVASLARSGVALDLGLSGVGKNPHVAVDRINAHIAQRMGRGETLSEALAAADNGLPPIYRAVVQIGLRCGRLPAGLEGLSESAQGMSDVRRKLAAAFLYPLIVCTLTYVLFVGYCLFLLPTFAESFLSLTDEPGSALTLLIAIGDWLPVWAGIPPLLVVVFFSSWLRPSATSATSFLGMARPLGWLPGVSRVGFEYRCSSLSRALALLLEHKVPLPAAIRLAAEVSGDRRLARAAEPMAASLEQGAPATDLTGGPEFPPFLRWALTSSEDSAEIVEPLRLAGDIYRNRAQQHAEWLRVLLPVVICVVIGGGVTLLYALSLFLPFVQLLQTLA